MDDLLDPVHLSSIKSRKAIDQLVWHINDHNGRFAVLVSRLSGHGMRCAEKAAWVMIHVLDRWPALFDAHNDEVLDIIQQPEASSTLRRNLIRCYADTRLPERRMGLLADIALSFLSDPSEAKAVRMFSYNVLRRIAVHQPDIMLEVRVIMKDVAEQSVGHLSVLARRLMAETQDD